MPVQSKLSIVSSILGSCISALFGHAVCSCRMREKVSASGQQPASRINGPESCCLNCAVQRTSLNQAPLHAQHHHLWRLQFGSGEQCAFRQQLRSRSGGPLYHSVSYHTVTIACQLDQIVSLCTAPLGVAVPTCNVQANPGSSCSLCQHQLIIPSCLFLICLFYACQLNCSPFLFVPPLHLQLGVASLSLAVAIRKVRAKPYAPRQQLRPMSMSGVASFGLASPCLCISCQCT